MPSGVCSNIQTLPVNLFLAVHPDAQARLADPRLKQLEVGNVTLLARSSGTNLALDRKILLAKAMLLALLL